VCFSPPKVIKSFYQAKFSFFKLSASLFRLTMNSIYHQLVSHTRNPIL